MRPAILLITMAAGFSLAGGAWIASARQSDDDVVVSGRTASLAEEQRSLKQAKEQASRARALSQQLDAQASAASRDAERLTAQLTATAARVQESEADLRAGQARIGILNHMIAGQAAELARQQGPLIRLTAALQSVSRRPPLLALAQPGSLRDAMHVRASFAHILPVIRTRTATLRASLDHTRQLQRMTAQASSALKSAQTQLARQRVTLARLETQKRLAARSFSSSAALEAERALAMGERARDIDMLMAQMSQASNVRSRLAALAGPQLRPPAPSADAPAATASAARDSTPAYRMPVIGTLVTGMGEVSDSGVRSRGITVSTSAGAQVVAPAKGRIVFAGPYGGFGQILIIDHGDGWTSLLTDLARLSVAVGQDVTQNEPIGVTGNGAHPAITIELRRQGRPMDVVAMTTPS